MKRKEPLEHAINTKKRNTNESEASSVSCAKDSTRVSLYLPTEAILGVYGGEKTRMRNHGGQQVNESNNTHTDGQTHTQARTNAESELSEEVHSGGSVGHVLVPHRGLS